MQPLLLAIIALLCLLPAAAHSQEVLQVQLEWTDNSDNEDGFVVQRAQDGGPWLNIADLPADAVSYIDPFVAYNVEYSYRVYAYNQWGSSGTTSAVSVTRIRDIQIDDIPQGTAPAAPGDPITVADAIRALEAAAASLLAAR